MNVMSSFDKKYLEKLNVAIQFFPDREVVSRQELLEFQDKCDIQLPSKFWANHRVGRGMFSLKVPEKISDLPEKISSTEEVVALVNHKKNSDAITRFSYDEMIPEAKDTFVEWGNFKTLETLLKTNQFFTLYITGDSGSGKNEMIAQACAKLQRPMVRVSITRETKEEHLIGSKTLIDGSIMYDEGPVIWAAENGAVLILDELSLAECNEIMSLQSVLEGDSFFVKSANKLVKPVPGFCVIATDNTKGRGSDSGRYIGTNILNDAFLERFEMTMEQGYPTEKIERTIIEKMMDKIGLVDEQFANKLVQWVHSIRKVYVEEGLEEQITTRRACHIIKTYAKLKNPEKAIELCVNRFDETTKMAMISLWEKLVPAT